MSCIWYLGFRDPLAGVQTLCDGDKACWLRHFTSDSEYKDCIDQADNQLKDCQDECAVDDDTSGIDSTHTDCLDACDSAFDDCNQACQDAYDAAVAACPDPVFDPAGNAACVGPAFATFVACQETCANQWGHCRSGCDDNYQIALASLPFVDRRCTAKCCNADSENVNRQDADCQFTQDTAHQQAQIKYWTCFSLCLDPVNGGHDPDCTNVCNNKRVLALFDADAAADECLTDNSNQWSDIWTDCGINYWCIKPCTTAYTAAQRACIAANLEGGDEATYQACLLEALQNNQRCTTNCCYNMNGKSEYDVAALECVITIGSCLAGIPGECPFPKSGPGDVCFDSSSPGCLAAMAAYDDCTKAATCNCNREYKSCLDAITSDPKGACGGCVFVAPPDLSSCD